MDNHHLTGYMPIDRRVALAEGGVLPDAATGAALFADIAGFTAVSGALTRRYGARGGAERMSNQLNLTYGALTDEVHSWGGSVIDFSGDAIMCWFDDAPNRRIASPGAARATACALRLQESTSSLPPLAIGEDDRRFNLSIKVAVATGTVMRAAVGDPRYRLVDVIAGPAIDRVAGAERHAAQGEVVIHEAAAHHLAGVRIRNWKTGDDRTGRVAVIDALGTLDAQRCPWSDSDLDATVAADWVDSQLRDRPPASLTELRPTSAMFVGFGGMDSGRDVYDVQAFDRFIRCVQHVSAIHGGSIVQITMGDKGGYLYIAFGAPVAYEDVAARAATTTLDLCDLASDHGAIGPLRCGLTLGLSRTGEYGGSACRTYGVLGENVNLAARLMVTAEPGEILVAPGFARSCGTDFGFVELPPVELKGYRTPVPIMRLMNRSVSRGPARNRAPLIGRHDELQEILGLVGLITTGPGGTLVIEGDAGIGKSHLAERARHTMLDSEDISWFECPASEHAAGSLAAFLPLLIDLFFQELGPTDETRRQLFDATIDALIGDVETRGSVGALEACRCLQESRPYIAALLGLRWDGSAHEQHDPRTRFERCMRGIDDLLRAESLRRPVVVHVRDAHWLDPDSVALVARLASSAHRFPIAVLVDQRPGGPIGPRGGPRGGQPSDQPGIDQLFPYQRLDLSGLDVNGGRALIETLLGGSAEADLIDAILDRSEGNPLFIEQLVLDLRERGLLVSDEGTPWRLTGTIERDLPLTLAAVLLSRIDRLGAAQRVAVQFAAVLGTEFNCDVLRLMTVDELSEMELAKAIAMVERAGVWIPKTDRPGWKTFSHALLRQIAYDMQLDERLRLLHAKAGAAIESSRPLAESGRAAALGHHAERAGDPAKAWQHFAIAGRETAAQSAHGPALEFFERALAHASTANVKGSEALEVRRAAGDLADLLGQYARSIDHYDAALIVADSSTHDRTEVLHRAARSLQRWGRYDEAESRYDQAINELQADLDIGLAARIYAGLSMVHCHQGKLDDAEELAELALLFARTASDDALLTEAHKNLGIVHLRAGRSDRATAHSRESLDIAQKLGDLAGQAAVWNNLGLLAATDGRTAEATACLRTSVGLFERAGNDHGLANSLDNLAGLLHDAGEEHEAMECLERAIGILASIGLRDHDVFGAMWKSGTW